MANKVTEKHTLEEIVGSMALRSRTRFPSLQKVKLALGSSNPGSVQRHLTSGPNFSITSNRTIPPSTSSSSPGRTSARHPRLVQNRDYFPMLFEEIF